MQLSIQLQELSFLKTAIIVDNFGVDELVRPYTTVAKI